MLQQNPGLSALAARSSVINTAAQTLTENGNPASVLAVGAGLANCGGVAVSEHTCGGSGHGIVRGRDKGVSTLPATVPFQLTNTGSTSLNLSVVINRRTAENNAATSINLPNLTLAPGASSTGLSMMLSGKIPNPGIYEGFVTITGAANPINIPYLYLVGDGVPAKHHFHCGQRRFGKLWDNRARADS